MNFLDKLAAQIPFKRPEEPEEFIFALNIGLAELEARVWSVSGKHLKILGQAQAAYHSNEDIIEEASQVLDQALGPLPAEPKKILFGVPDSWTSDDNLKEEYLKILRRMLKEFELEPLAYVTLSHAIAHNLQKQDGVPPTALLVGLGDFVEIALVRGGKVVASRSTARSDRLFEDIEKILGGFDEVEVLPSKILLYPTKSGIDLDKIKDDLMSYPWMSKLPFLHFPRIESLDRDIATKSLILAGALEINPDIDFKNLEVGPEQKKKNVLLEEAQELGFVAGDIKKKEMPAGKLKRYHGGEEVEMPEKEVEDLVDDALVSDVSQEVYQPKVVERKPILDRPKISLPMVPNQILPDLSGVLKSRLIILPAVLVVFLLLYFALIKASVTVFVEPKVLEKVAEVIADPNVKSVDADKKIIPGNIIDTTETGSDKGSATGSKQIGDPARGQVIIYNKTDSSLSLASGTILSSNNLKFTLDTSVQVASSSSTVGADFQTVTSPGKSGDIGVTASDIGPDSNLPAGTLLSVANYSQSQVVAKVDNALSGGTSKTVTVVTSDDQQKLQAQVIANLKRQAANDLQTKAGDKKVIPEGLAVVDGKYNFNKRIGDQATDFSLNATVHFKGTAYSESDLRSIVGKLVETNVPDGFTLDLQNSETQSNIEKVDKDGKLYFLAKFKANLLPKLDLGQLKSMMRGQSINGAINKLKTLDNVVGAEIKLSPNLPKQLNAIYRLPLLDQNISVTIAPK